MLRNMDEMESEGSGRRFGQSLSNRSRICRCST